MKKFVLATVVVMFAATSAFAQDEAAAYSQGQSTVAVGYGFGNIYKRLFKIGAAFGSGGTGTYKVSSTGPYSLTYEYGVSDKISVGISGAYTSVSSKYTDATYPTDNYTEKLTNYSVVVRGNYHFGSSEKFDPYIGLGLGYYKFKYVYKDDKGVEDKSAIFAIPGSFAFNGQLGAKYYFTDNVGAFAEIGYVAGGIGQVGIAFKF